MRFLLIFLLSLCPFLAPSMQAADSVPIGWSAASIESNQIQPIEPVQPKKAEKRKSRQVFWVFVFLFALFGYLALPFGLHLSLLWLWIAGAGTLLLSSIGFWLGFSADLATIDSEIPLDGLWILLLAPIHLLLLGASVFAAGLLINLFGLWLAGAIFVGLVLLTFIILFLFLGKGFRAPRF